MVSRRNLIAVSLVGVVVALGVLLWWGSRTKVIESRRTLSWRVTREEVERKIPRGSTYKQVVGSFGLPTRDIKFGWSARSLTYITDTNLSTPGTYMGFTVYLRKNRLTDYIFNSDKYSPQN